MYLSEVQIVNTHAANLIEEGKVEHAYHLLQDGVSSLSSCVLSPAPIDHYAANHESSFLEETDKDERQDLMMISEGDQVDEDEDREYYDEDDDEGESSVQIEVYSLEEEQAVEVDSVSEFYCHPFAFEYPTAVLDSPESSLSDYQYNATAITFLYNQGLCCQLAWKQSKTRNTAFLAKATRFYHEAMSLLQSNTSRPPFRPQGSVLKVVFAICVNAAHCHTELAQFSMVHLYNTWIHELNLSIVDHEEQVWEDAAEFLSLRRHLMNRCDPTVSPAA